MLESSLCLDYMNFAFVDGDFGHMTIIIQGYSTFNTIHSVHFGLFAYSFYQ